MNELEQALKLDLESTTNEIVGFIKNIVSEAKADGIVVGISGGVDSALTAALSVRAIGPEKVLGLLLPLGFTPSKDTEDAKELCEKLEIKYMTIPIESITQQCFKQMKSDLNDPKHKIPSMNLRARTRMIVIYYFANLNNYLVGGTGDKSEDLIGFFTKYGDGGVDFLPISHLYKTQVRELARYLGVPGSIAGKPASPQLYPGHQATDEIPLGYEKMDPVMVGLFDKQMTPAQVSEITGVPLSAINLILKKYKVSEHKRKYPPMVKEW